MAVGDEDGDAVVEDLWRHPVKSLLGERCPGIEVTPRGVALDRWWGVYGRDGKIGSGKSTRRFRRMRDLHRCRARLSPCGELAVGLPEGSERRGVAEAEAALGAWLGEPVRLLTETSVRHMDERPVHLLTTTDLEHLGGLVGGDAVDVRRFRPNLVLRAGWRTDDARLDGGRLEVGDAVLRLCETAERCVMVTFGWDELAAEPEVLRKIDRHGGRRFGRYAVVERPGRIRRGDRARLAPAPA